MIPYLAPDATALGQIFWYTSKPRPANRSIPRGSGPSTSFTSPRNSIPRRAWPTSRSSAACRLEYQIDVRPEELRAYGITLGELYSAVAKSNMPAGGGVIQKNNAEYIVRSVGWIQDGHDIENTVIKEVNGTPIYVRNVAKVQLGTQFRRSVYEKDGNEVVGGAVLMRHGENPLAVTRRMKHESTSCSRACPRACTSCRPTIAPD